jgi:SAM-dependent methyltransferase
MAISQQKKAPRQKKEQPSNCTLCGHDKIALVRTGIREDPAAEVYGCMNCGFQFLAPPGYDLRTYYREEYRKAHSYVPGTQLTPQEQFDLMRPLVTDRVALFKEYIPKGAKVLEVGCSSGFFLDAIRDEYTVYGNEWNPDEAEFVRGMGIPCSEEPLEDAFPGESFTAIVSFHVLEHVPAPVEWLKLIKERLIGGGYIHIEVPNTENALTSIYNIPPFRDRYYRQPHLGYWNKDTLAGALGTLGFEARISLREEYSLGNHLRWLLTGEGDPDVRTARTMYSPVPLEHPAAPVVNRWFMLMDRQYRNLLDTLKASSLLVAVGRKREI